MDSGFDREIQVVNDTCPRESELVSVCKLNQRLSRLERLLVFGLEEDRQGTLQEGETPQTEVAEKGRSGLSVMNSYLDW